jgi:hypothetical protein
LDLSFLNQIFSNAQKASTRRPTTTTRRTTRRTTTATKIANKNLNRIAAGTAIGALGLGALGVGALALSSQSPLSIPKENYFLICKSPTTSSVEIMFADKVYRCLNGSIIETCQNVEGETIINDPLIITDNTASRKKIQGTSEPTDAESITAGGKLENSSLKNIIPINSTESILRNDFVSTSELPEYESTTLESASENLEYSSSTEISPSNTTESVAIIETVSKSYSANVDKTAMKRCADTVICSNCGIKVMFETICNSSSTSNNMGEYFNQTLTTLKCYPILQAPVPAEKPGFFKRAKNKVYGWFGWGKKETDTITTTTPLSVDNMTLFEIETFV